MMDGFNHLVASLFSSTKKMAGMVMILLVAIAVPVTLGLIKQNQDNRQEASTNRCLHQVQYCPDGSVAPDLDANCNPICQGASARECQSDGECVNKHGPNYHCTYMNETPHWTCKQDPGTCDDSSQCPTGQVCSHFKCVADSSGSSTEPTSTQCAQEGESCNVKPCCSGGGLYCGAGRCKVYTAPSTGGTGSTDPGTNKGPDGRGGTTNVGAPVLTASTGPCGGSVHLSWTAVTGATGYQIRRYYTGVTNNIFNRHVGVVTSYTDTGPLLDINRSFTYEVRARRSDGSLGPLSNKSTAISSGNCSPTATRTPTRTPTRAPTRPQATNTPTVPPTAGPACGISCETSAACTGAQNGCSTCVTGNNGQKTCQSTTNSNQINLALAVQLPGIGSASGDNASPVRTTRSGDVEVYNTQNEKVKDADINFSFQSASQSAIYRGTVELTGLAEGAYYVKVKFDNTVFQQLPGVYNLKKGTNTLTPVTLTPGDLNQDNALDMQDYSIFVACYGEKDCEAKEQADFNDDGKVDGIDYNILIRSFAIRSGD